MESEFLEKICGWLVIVFCWDTTFIDQAPGTCKYSRPGLSEFLTAALDWQKHSVRGFIATLGKKVRIECFKKEQGTRRYKTL